MILSARPTVSPEICLVLKSEDGRTTCAKTMTTTDRDCGSSKWINKIIYQYSMKY